MLQRLRADDSGLTLIEVLITAVLMGIVSSIMTAAAITTLKSLHHVDDEAQGQTDVRTVTERLTRDIRDARSVAAGADSGHLVLWIDYNSDYIQQANETITWQLGSTLVNGHYPIVRSVCQTLSTGANPTCTAQGTSTTQGRTLIDNAVFTYDATAPATKLVTSTLKYNAILGQAASDRSVTFATRLRNI